GRVRGGGGEGGGGGGVGGGVGEHEVQHGNAEQRQKHEEAPVPPAPLKVPVGRVNLVVLDGVLQFVGHVADREEVDQGGDEGDHHEHDGRQHVDAEADLEGGAARLAAVDSRPGHVPLPALFQFVVTALGVERL